MRSSAGCAGLPTRSRALPRSGTSPGNTAAGRRPATFALFCLLLTTAAAAQDTTLDRRHADFLDSVDPILSDTERRVFGELRHAYQRDAFVQRFWAVRDPYPETPQNEFRERFEHAVETAGERFGDARDDRFESLLLHGEPLRTFRTTCELLRTLEVWHYPHSPAVRGEFYLIFLRQGGGFRLWTAADGFSSLLAFATVSTDRDAQLREINRRCSRGGDLLSAFGLALDWQAMGAEAPDPGRADDEWALAFLDRSTETPDGAEALPAEITLRYPGRRGNRTVVQAIVGIDPALLPEPGDGARRFVLDGEVLRRGELFENFRYRFEPRARPGGEAAAIPLITEPLPAAGSLPAGGQGAGAGGRPLLRGQCRDRGAAGAAGRRRRCRCGCRCAGLPAGFWGRSSAA